jgi:hypothetical protein
MKRTTKRRREGASREGFREVTMSKAKYYRRVAAAEYLKQKYGFGSLDLLARLANDPNGPPRFIVGRVVVYPEGGLDNYALSRLKPATPALTAQRSQAAARARAAMKVKRAAKAAAAAQAGA